MSTSISKVTPFARIKIQAEANKGHEALEAALPRIKSDQARLRIKDDRWLSEMTKRVFQAGFKWSLIEEKWPHFEEAFEGFAPQRWISMSDADLDAALVECQHRQERAENRLGSSKRGSTLSAL